MKQEMKKGKASIKQLSLLAASFLLFTGTLLAQTLHLMPEKPTPGQTINFQYNPSETPLKGMSDIKANIYCLSRKRGYNSIRELSLSRAGNQFTGSFVTDTNTVALAFSFFSAEKKDHNREQGYLFYMYDAKGQVQPGTYQTIGLQFRGLGKMYYELPENKKLGADYLQKEWDLFPATREGVVDDYFNSLMDAGKAAGTARILNIIKKAQTQPIPEIMYTYYSGWATYLKDKDLAEALDKEMKEKYPDGRWKYRAAGDALMKNLNDIDKDPLEKERLFNEYINVYAAKPGNPDFLSGMEARLAYSFINAKDTSKRDIQKYKFYADKVPMNQRVFVYRGAIEFFLAENIHPELCNELGDALVKWSKNELANPTEKKRPIETEKEWREERERQYALNAHVYGHVLYKSRDYQKGLSYARESVTVSKYDNATYNNDYALLLEKVVRPAEIKQELSPLVKEGKTGTEIKNVLRRALIKTEGSEEKANIYIASLSKQVDNDAKTEIAKKILNTPAPDFTLKNMNGAEVSLASFKGKVVILDFWATWCGPCKRSFPIMQTMVEKYKTDPNVVFLFIDTWEELPQDQREKQVSDYITKNKFDFNVLYDVQEVKGEQDSYITKSKFKVQGIPAKFVIGKDGLLKFSTVGYPGEDANDKFVLELSDMIDIAGSQSL